MSDSACSSSGRPTLARSIAWPPAMPAPPAARASRPHRRACSAGATLPSIGRQDLERERLHGVAGEHRLGDAEADVHRRLAAAEDVVVHARQVVVDQRIGVDQLDRARRAQRRRRGRRGPHRRRRARAAAAGACRRRARRSASPRRGRPARRRERRRRAPTRPRRARRAPRCRRRPASCRATTARSWPSSSTLTCCSTASRRDAAVLEQLGAAPIAREQALERQLAALHRRDERLELAERHLVAGRHGGCRRGTGIGRHSGSEKGRL